MKLVYTCLLTITTCLLTLSINLAQAKTLPDSTTTLNYVTSGSTQLEQASSFPSVCEVTPSRLTSTAVTGTSAELTWWKMADNVQFEIQWRALASNDSCSNKATSTEPWTTVSNITGIRYTLTGLNLNRCYQWRIRTLLCQTSKFSEIMLFRTTPCDPVTILGYASGVSQALVGNSINGWNVPVKGGGPITYQWYKDGTAPENKLVGMTTEWVIIPNKQFSDAGVYNCLVSNGCSSAFSAGLHMYVFSCYEGTVTVRDGSWDDPGIWSCGMVPYRFDTVSIRHSVSVPANYTGYVRKLNYSAGSKLTVPSTSKIEVGEYFVY
jgi:hypothetical protein